MTAPSVSGWFYRFCYEYNCIAVSDSLTTTSTGWAILGARFAQPVLGSVHLSLTGTGVGFAGEDRFRGDRVFHAIRQRLGLW